MVTNHATLRWLHLFWWWLRHVTDVFREFPAELKPPTIHCYVFTKDTIDPRADVVKAPPPQPSPPNDVPTILSLPSGKEFIAAMPARSSSSSAHATVGGGA